MIVEVTPSNNPECDLSWEERRCDRCHDPWALDQDRSYIGKPGDTDGIERVAELKALPNFAAYAADNDFDFEDLCAECADEITKEMTT